MVSEGGEVAFYFFEKVHAEPLSKQLVLRLL